MSDTVLHRIGGRPVPAADRRTFPDIGPATGQRIAEVARGSAEDVDSAVAAAQDALAGAWGRTTTAERADLLDEVADRIESRLDEFAEIESRDTGKPITLAKTIDIPRAVANFRFFAGAIRHDETGFHRMAGALNYTLRKRLGVVALITPWNLPLYLLSWKTAPALGMGNAVVAKPSEMTPMTATALGDVLHEAGAPAGAYNVVHGFGNEVGGALVTHPGVKAVSFTGGTATGEIVAAAAAPMFKKLSLELGGKNPTIVFDDCDFDDAVEGATRAGFTNQGQVCLCGSRILVQETIAERFTAALAARAKAMVVGDPSDPATGLGALISADHRDKVESYVELAKEEGGTILSGGTRPDLPAPFDGGSFFTPTVIGGLASTCRTATEEIFGPIVTVHSFRDEDEAVAMANGVRYGLAASVWTKDLDRAHRMGERLQSGIIWVNTWLMRDLRTPFGGVKDSGVGREGGRWSLEFFSEAVNVCVKLGEKS